MVPKSSLHELLSLFTEFGPNFGMHISLSKCDLYWPSGGSFFPDFPPAIKRVNPEKCGLELFGSPVWGPPQFFTTFLSTQLDKISGIQDKLCTVVYLMMPGCKPHCHFS